MASMLNKIADAVTGHHSANTTAAGTNAPLTNNAAMGTGAPLGTGIAGAPVGNAVGGVGSNFAGTNYSATNNGALKEGAQVRDTGMAHTQGTMAHGVAGSTSSHPTATGAAKGGAAGALVGHPVAGAAAGAALGHHEHGTNSHLHSSTSSSTHSSTHPTMMEKIKDAVHPHHNTTHDSTHNSTHAGAMGAGALGAGALGAGALASHNTTHNSAHVGTTGAHIGTGVHAHGTEHQISHDNVMTRHEEHLLVGKEKVNVGEAALHKYVTTEHVSTAVPIIKERAVIEREPITDANRHTALTGGSAFKEAHIAVNLMEERAVAEKEAVAIENVRLRKEQELTQQHVSADLRKEHIEIVDGTQGKGIVHGGVAGAVANAATHHTMGANAGQPRQL